MAIAHFEELIRKKVIVNKSPFKTRKRLPNITLFGQNAELKDFFVEKVRYL